MRLLLTVLMFAILIVPACGKSEMQSDWDELTDTQRILMCKLYDEHPDSDFSGAATDLGWDVESMVRFLDKHC